MSNLRKFAVFEVIFLSYPISNMDSVGNQLYLYVKRKATNQMKNEEIMKIYTPEPLPRSNWGDIQECVDRFIKEYQRKQKK